MIRLLTIFGVVEQRQMRLLFDHMSNRSYGQILARLRQEGLAYFSPDGQFLATSRYSLDHGKTQEAIMAFWAFIQMRDHVLDFCASEPPAILSFSSADKDYDLISGTTVEITNQRMASIMIHKIDAATGAGIYGVKFVLYDSGKNPIGEYTTDQDGYIYIDDELVPGKYYLRELEAADGYIRDEQYKTVYVERGKCAQIEWENSAVTGQIQIRKYSSEDNTVTGQLAGTPLEGAVFEITQARSGKVVGYIVTDARGVAASGPLPLGRYFVTEVSAPKYYQLSGEKMEAEIEYPSQIIKLSAYNKPASLGVTIKKSGNYEVQSGQSMSYDFSGIANTSNVALNHFFWHDRIPTDATRALSISTGTYNARLYYKVTFKTNLNDYRTLASNLLTSNNYSLSLNAATLRLAQGEYVTDVRFEFGTVPSGFSSVVKPTMRVQVLGTVSNGYQIINRADVGGQYLNEWQTAKTTWVTTVRRFNTTPLPKTGY